jgi:hypothetical protein
MRWRMRLKGRTERGAAVVEFALVVPILLLIFFAMINFGMVFAAQLSLDNAARDAARYAVVDVEGRACGDIEQHADDSVWMDTPTPVFNLTSTAATPGPCESPCEGSEAHDDITVTLDYTAELLIPVFPFPDSIALTGEGVFRCEYT